MIAFFVCLIVHPRRHRRQRFHSSELGPAQSENAMVDGIQSQASAEQNHQRPRPSEVEDFVAIVQSHSSHEPLEHADHRVGH